MERTIVVSGEDPESEDEFDRTTALMSMSMGHSQIVSGEAPETDAEEEFGSTVSLASSFNSTEERDETNNANNSQYESSIVGPIVLSPKPIRMDPAVIKKYRERNKSLRNNIAEKFLKPVVAISIKKIDRLSQNLSNSQMQMQEALFQSRLATGNLLKLQKELESFLEADYLKELKISDPDSIALLNLKSSVKLKKMRTSSSLPTESTSLGRPKTTAAEEAATLIITETDIHSSSEDISSILRSKVRK